jgi:hypothetical protein
MEKYIIQKEENKTWFACNHDLLEKTEVIGDSLRTGDVLFTKDGQLRDDRDVWVRGNREVQVIDG